MYKYQVNFSKRFTSGMFVGKLYHDYLRFADWHSADEFKNKCESGHEFTPCAGDSAYKVEDVILIAIEPTNVRAQKRDKVNGQYK
jgi:hypothetical protein